MPKGRKRRGSVAKRGARARARQARGSTRGSRRNRARTKQITARKRAAMTRTPSPTVTTKKAFENPFGVVGRARKK